MREGVVHAARHSAAVLVTAADLERAVERPAGGARRLQALLRVIARRHDRVDIVQFADGPVDGMRASRLIDRHWGIAARVTVIGVPVVRGGAWRRYVAPILGRRHALALAPYVRPETIEALRVAVAPDVGTAYLNREVSAAAWIGAFGRRGDVPTVFDIDDLACLTTARSAAAQPFGLRGALLRCHWPAAWRWDRALVRACDVTLVCSDVDRQRLEGTRSAALVPFPNALPGRAWRVSEGATDVVMVGTYHYRPNLDGARWFVESVWPAVRARCPGARLVLAGEIDASNAARLRVEGVEVAGYVDDLDALYRRAAVAIAPIFVGAGTRIKLIEAAISGVAAVSTTLGAEGLSLVDGREVLIRDDASGFAEACVQLLERRDDRLRIARAAHALATDRYTVDAVVERLAAELDARVPVPNMTPGLR